MNDTENRQNMVTNDEHQYRQWRGHCEYQSSGQMTKRLQVTPEQMIVRTEETQGQMLTREWITEQMAS